MISIFASGKLFDSVHTRHVKLTLMIISNKGEAIRKKLLANFCRGITVIDAEGAYTAEKRKVLFTVITRMNWKM